MTDKENLIKLKERLKVLSIAHDILIELIDHLEAGGNPNDWLLKKVNQLKEERQNVEANLTILQIQMKKK